MDPHGCSTTASQCPSRMSQLGTVIPLLAQAPVSRLMHEPRNLMSIKVLAPMVQLHNMPIHCSIADNRDFDLNVVG